MTDLSIIIVNYNAGDFLLKCLDSIQTNVSDTISYEVIVVDNDSADESIDLVKSAMFPPRRTGTVQRLKIIENGENLGFSKANNIGVKNASGRYILFLNPDTIIFKDTLERLVSFMDKTPDAGASTCFLELTTGKLDDGAHRGFPTPWNSFTYFSGLSKLLPKSELFNGYNMAWKDLDKIHTVDAIVGAFMLVRREAGEQIGWWDEDYFFYGEDLEFCYQLKEKGWKIYFVPEVKAMHYKGVTSGIKKSSAHVTTANPETKRRATQARFNAMKIFYKKHYEKKYPTIVTKLVFAGINVKLLATLKKNT